MEKTKEEKKGLFFRFINGVEVIGNKLPHPFYLFTILIVVAIVLSVIFAGVSVTYESASSKGTGGEIVTVTIKNLLNKETINYVTQNLYSIYYNFSPMMMMGLLMLSIGLAEQVGLFGAFIKRTIAGVRPAFVFAIVSFIAINANTASNAGILGCTAVAAAVFASMGYNPWLGIILAYAAGNAGMSANVFVGNLDVLLSGINESVCSSLGIDTSTVHVLQNWYFMFACAIILTVVFTVVTTKFVRGFIGEAKDLSLIQIGSSDKDLSPLEHKALRNTAIAAVIYLALLVIICIPQNSVFRADDGSLVPNSPLLKSVLTLLFLFFMVTGIAYGRTTGALKDWNSLPKMLAGSINSMVNFMVIALPASLFIYLFNASNIPTALGAAGAEWIKTSGINGFGLIVFIVFFSVTVGFAVTKMKWKFRNAVAQYFRFGIMIPVAIALIPLFQIYSRSNLLNTRTCLIITYIAFGLSLSIYLVQGYLRSFPDDIMEAAVIDGCGIYRLMWHIVTPLMKNSIVTVLVLQFFFKWNDLLFSMTFISDSALKTVQTGLLYFSDEFGSKNWGAIFASVSMSVFPLLILYMALNKKLMEGMTAGAVKG